MLVARSALDAPHRNGHLNSISPFALRTLFRTANTIGYVTVKSTKVRRLTHALDNTDGSNYGRPPAKRGGFCHETQSG